MPSAVVTGATGISGSAIVHHLLKDPSYDQIYSFSRRNPGHQDPKIKHVTLDLQASAPDMAKSLSGISAEHIFFCAYLARDDPEELNNANAALLSNFLQALYIAGATRKIRRFVLACGFKHYGVHLGASKQPFLESDPLLANGAGGVSWPTIFYYEQQRILARAADKGSFEWVVTLPEDVLGYARGNFMNEATSIGLYCAVSKVLPGSELPFPGSKANYFAFNCWTSANLHAKFCLWAATAPGAGNNIFNVMNGDTESFQNLWPRLASRFGCRIPDPMFPHGGVPGTGGFKNYESSTIVLQNLPPLRVQETALGISSSPSVEERPMLFLQVDPEKWAKRKDVVEAWGRLRDRYDLDQEAWEKVTWDFLVLTMVRDWSCVASMSKARKLGWTGYADTWDELEETFEVLEREGFLVAGAILIIAAVDEAHSIEKCEHRQQSPANLFKNALLLPSIDGNDLCLASIFKGAFSLCYLAEQGIEWTSEIFSKESMIRGNMLAVASHELGDNLGLLFSSAVNGVQATATKLHQKISGLHIGSRQDWGALCLAVRMKWKIDELEELQGKLRAYQRQLVSLLV